jgi:TRAP-type C4-dicarboxylate transport system substrate-binding protein
VFHALGFEPMAVDIKRFVQEIAGDTFDAHDNPLTNIYTFGVHRHHRHITLSGHFFGASFMLCNASQYRGWPTDVRAVVDEAAIEAMALQRRLAASEDEDVLKKLDPRENDVVHLTPEEHAAFVAAVEPVRAKRRGELDPKLFALLER